MLHSMLRGFAEPFWKCREIKEIDAQQDATRKPLNEAFETR